MIRWRRDGDEEAIVRLVEEELLPLSSRNAIRGSHLRKDIAERLRQSFTLVASRTERSDPYAFIIWQLRGHILFIDLLAVDSAYQNRNLGTVLMSAAEQSAVQQGCSESRVFVDDRNRRGMRFYAKLGYSPLRHIPGPDCYELSKPLAVSWN